MINARVPVAVPRAARATLGAVFGAITAVAGLVVLGSGRAATLRWHARRDRQRLVRWFHAETVRELPDRDPRGYLLLRAGHGMIGGFLLIVALTASIGYLGWALELTVRGRISIADGAVSASVGIVGVYLCVRFAFALGAWDTGLALRRLGDDSTQRRLRQLERTRADVVRAVDEERRRIERALHDGVQQRAVALALQLGRTRRNIDPGRTEVVTELDQALAEAQRLIHDLREVAWRIYPSVLDEHGLEVALRGLSAHTTMPLHLQIHLNRPLPPIVAATTYFVIAEAVTNAVKHSGAQEVSVSIRASPRQISVAVHDDGCGGADPAGAGLTGLLRRVAALDGSLHIFSPTGGPTTLTAELPCTS
ncbi:sensor histidine kinase [Nocardia lijiangensis]|uniref:sensor histidine kinase n=1 Tax=Nocardia lijiangensis TaxID=299618 RepID=UPI003D74681B